MTTSTLAPGTPAPARSAVPRPLWERDRLFLEPDLPEALDLDEDDEAEGE